jgi:hypothetical protein
MLKKIITGAAILGALMFGGRANAASGSVEIMAGDKSTTLDLKVAGELVPRLGIFARNRTTVDYDKQVSTFGLIDLSYNLVEGLDVVAEAQFSPQAGFVPRLGLQYFHQFGDLSTYFLSTVSLSENPDSENVASLQYKPKITEEMKLYSSLEALTNIGGEGHNFSVQRLRLGLDASGFQFGVAGDFLEIGNEAQVSCNVGGFVSGEF